MKAKLLKISFLAIIIMFASNVEAATCNFSRDLGIGSRGSDVSCLQQHLTSTGAGYLVADGVYGYRTSQAVSVWQSQNQVPVSGYFGASSRAKYFDMYGGNYGYGQVLGASTSSVYETTYSTNLPYYGSKEAQARQKITDAIETIEDARDEIDDSYTNVSEAEEYYEDAVNDLFDAIREFLARDFNSALDLADDAEQNAEDAIDEADGRSGNDHNDAEDAIENAEDMIDDAENEIEDADDDGRYVGEAENLLEEAEDRLDEAEEEFEDGDYEDAVDLAEEAEDLAEEAIDAIY